MKFYAALLLLTVGQASAFSAVAPPKASTSVMGGAEPIDPSMKGIDAEGSFDPTEGANPALKRNNNDGVWVSQVRGIELTRVMDAANVVMQDTS